MNIPKKEIENKLNTYNTLIYFRPVTNSPQKVEQIEDLKRDLFAYLLDIAEGYDVDWCQLKADEIKKKLEFMGCENIPV
mgnify:CR=1 FL=1